MIWVTVASEALAGVLGQEAMLFGYYQDSLQMRNITQIVGPPCEQLLVTFSPAGWAQLVLLSSLRASGVLRAPQQPRTFTFLLPAVWNGLWTSK